MDHVFRTTTFFDERRRSATRLLENWCNNLACSLDTHVHKMVTHDTLILPFLLRLWEVNIWERWTSIFSPTHPWTMNISSKLTLWWLGGRMTILNCYARYAVRLRKGLIAYKIINVQKDALFSSTHFNFWFQVETEKN